MPISLACPSCAGPRTSSNCSRNWPRAARAELGIILKIESRQGFDQLPLIMIAALRHHPVGIMVARGDLAIEVGFERLAEVQEEILWLSEAAHIPVIWATQVLETLAKTGIPSRAEVTDAAMGVRAECVMLNKGEHILDAVRFLDHVLHRMQAHHLKKRSMLRGLAVAQVSHASSPSAPENEPAAARVGAALEHAVRDFDHGRRGRVAPFAGHGYLMSHRDQSLGGCAGDPALQVQLSGNEFVKGERSVEVLGLEARGFHCLLRIHAEVEDVQQHLQQRLVLIVAARRRQRQERLPVFEHHGRAQGHARTLARRELIRMPRREQKRLQAAPNGMPVSPAITDGSQAPLGVAETALPMRSPRSRRLCPAPPRRRLAVGSGPARRSCRTAFHRGVLRIDQLPALGGVLLREQHLLGNLAEFGIAVVAVAVGEGQLHGFDHGVQILGLLWPMARRS